MESTSEFADTNTGIRSPKHFEDFADEIYHLREEKLRVQLECAGRDELRKRIANMAGFLNEHPTAVTEYDEPLVRRLIEGVTIFEEEFTVELKLGMAVDVEE